MPRRPMLVLLIPLVTGIVAAERWWLPPGWLALCAGIALGMALLVRRHRIADLYLLTAVVLGGMGTAAVHHPVADLPEGVRLVALLRVEPGGAVRRGRIGVPCTVGGYRTEGDSVWRRSSQRLQVTLDSGLVAQAGEHRVATLYVHPLQDSVGRFALLQRARGITGWGFVPRRGVWLHLPARERSVALTAGQMQAWALDRLDRLGLDSSQGAIVRAMVAGSRSGMDRALRDRFARSGTAHLLAVSGLHVGIVFLLVNALLGWLPLLSRGHLIRNVLCVFVLWAYALMAGLSPSVVRAAVMFTALQLALASTSRYDGTNVLSAAAFLMLALRPGSLFDVSFQLSFVAVAGILLWAVPLYRRVARYVGPARPLVGLLLVGLAATVATAPLVSYWFGRIALVGLLLGPAVVVLAYGVVMAGIVWVVVPSETLAGMWSTLMGALAGWLDGAAAWGAGLRWGSVEVALPLWAVAVLYAVMIGVTVVLGHGRRKNTTFDP